jgi:tetratricopeptide (TPR) repeat protein
MIAAALEASPTSAGLHGLRGLFLAERGESEAADRAFARARELDADEVLALEARAQALLAKGDIDSAVGVYRRLADLQPRDVSALIAAADALAHGDRVDESAAFLRAVLEREPYNGPVALRLARQEAKAGRAKVALALAMRAARFGGGPEANGFLQERLAADAS